MVNAAIWNITVGLRLHNVFVHFHFNEYKKVFLGTKSDGLKYT